MNLVSAIKTIKAQRGVTNTFYAMLCDYCAFSEEDRWVQGIVKQICEDGYVTKLSKLPSTMEIADMMYKLTNQYGYNKNNVSNVFHKLALGLGVVKASFVGIRNSMLCIEVYHFRASHTRPNYQCTERCLPALRHPLF